MPASPFGKTYTMDQLSLVSSPADTAFLRCISSPDLEETPSFAFKAQIANIRKLIGHQTTNKGSVYVSKAFGNDSTGEREDAALPFLTLLAAQNAALPGDVIYVIDGQYREYGLGKDLVDWWFAPGTKVYYDFLVSPPDTTGYSGQPYFALFSDFSNPIQILATRSARRFSISGYGDFEMTLGAVSAPGVGCCFSCFAFWHAYSEFRVTCRNIKCVSDFVANTASFTVPWVGIAHQMRLDCYSYSIESSNTSASETSFAAYLQGTGEVSLNPTNVHHLKVETDLRFRASILVITTGTFILEVGGAMYRPMGTTGVHLVYGRAMNVTAAAIEIAALTITTPRNLILSASVGVTKLRVSKILRNTTNAGQNMTLSGTVEIHKPLGIVAPSSASDAFTTSTTLAIKAYAPVVSNRPQTVGGSLSWLGHTLLQDATLLD